MNLRTMNSRYEVLAFALKGNAKGKRWRFVIRDVTAKPFTAWASRYCYASGAEAAKAGRALLSGLS